MNDEGEKTHPENQVDEGHQFPNDPLGSEERLPPAPEPQTSIAFRSFGRRAVGRREDGALTKAICLVIIIAAAVAIGWRIHDYQPQIKDWLHGVGPVVAEPTPEPIPELTEPRIVAMLKEVTPEQKRISEKKYRLEDELNKRDLTWKVLRGNGYLQESSECQQVFKEARELKKNLIQANEQLAQLGEVVNDLHKALQDIRLQGYVISNPRTQKLVANVQVALGVKKVLDEVAEEKEPGVDPDTFMKALKDVNQQLSAPNESVPASTLDMALDSAPVDETPAPAQIRDGDSAAVK